MEERNVKLGRKERGNLLVGVEGEETVVWETCWG